MKKPSDASSLATSRVRDLSDSSFSSTPLVDPGITVLRGDFSVSNIVEAAHFGTTFVARIRANPHVIVWERDPATYEHILFIFVTHGTMVFSSTGGYSTSPDGGICLIYPGAEDFTFESKTPTEVLTFSFDGRKLGILVSETTRSGQLRANSPTARVAYAYLSSLLKTSKEIQGGSDKPLREMTQHLARALVADTAPVSGSKEHLLERATATINNWATSPSFGVPSLASILGVSRRTLERVYAEVHETPGFAIRAARLKIARTMIASNPTARFESVAVASGFGSVDSLRRALKSSRISDEPRELL
ncbi:helix-turn-helix domain-containing protein [Leucobacter sp. HNU]|uniref:helix-turn-helix domain-containing protein n=1 Tax=Leucobacter sp. HNU TaxID=3236805 RepID=UPI003A8056A7